MINANCKFKRLTVFIVIWRPHSRVKLCFLEFKKVRSGPDGYGMV